MSDTPKRLNWSSAGMLPATNGAFVHESDLDAATKERDEYRKGSIANDIARRLANKERDALRAQLSALPSATQEHHAQVIEDAAKVFSETIGSLEVLGTFYRHSPTWETCKIEDVLTEARKAHSALVSTILTTQPRKEGDEPCADILQPSPTTSRDVNAKSASASNAAHTSDPSGAATHEEGHSVDCAWVQWINQGKHYPNPGCTCGGVETKCENCGISLDEIPSVLTVDEVPLCIPCAKELGAEPTQDHLAGSGEVECPKPGCGAANKPGQPCSDFDCPQRTRPTEALPISDGLRDALNESDSYKAAWEKVSSEYQAALLEIRKLTNQIDLNRDEFLRIIAKLKSMTMLTEDAMDFIEIIGICERSQQVITQRVPVIEQRNQYEKEHNEAWRALNQIEVHFGFGDGSQCSPQEIADKLTTPHPTEATASAPSVSEAARQVFNALRVWRSVEASSEIESILTRLTGDQAKHIAELEADKKLCHDFVKKFGRWASNRKTLGATGDLMVIEARLIDRAATKPRSRWR